MRVSYVYCTVLMANAFLLFGFLVNGCSGFSSTDIDVAPGDDAGSETGLDDSTVYAETGVDAESGSDVAETGADSGPVIPDAGPPNVTFDTLAMPCFKAVIIEDATKKVVWGSGSSATCPTKLADIFVPSTAYTLIVWVKDPTNNLLSFNSLVSFPVTKARCSTYATAPTWAQLENDFSTQAFVAISNGATPPSYLFTKSCGSNAEYWIHR